MLLVHCSWSALTCSHVSPSPFSPSPFHHKHIEVFLTFPLITHAFPPFFLFFFFPSKPFHIIQFSLCRVGFSGQFLNFLAMMCSPGGFAQLCRLLGRFGAHLEMEIQLLPLQLGSLPVMRQNFPVLSFLNPPFLWIFPSFYLTLCRKLFHQLCWSISGPTLSFSSSVLLPQGSGNILSDI